MRIKKVLFILLTIYSANLFSSLTQDKGSIAPIPSWVKVCSPYSESNSSASLQGDIQYIHFDIQKNKEANTFYYCHAVKALTQRGTETTSKINISFSPSFEKVLLHTICVYRDGICLDRIKTACHTVIQREEELECNIYNGRLSLLYLLEDVRKGDIVEYSYSIIEESPPFDPYFYIKVYLDDNVSWERMSFRLLAHPDFPFLAKTNLPGLEPAQSSLSPDLCEWLWEVKQTPKHRKKDPDEPSWFDPFSFLEISEFTSWQEVASTVEPFYRLPDTLKNNIPDSMKQLIQSWQQTSQAPEDLAKLALQFVQDEIRYFSISEGIGAFKPSHPIATFERRFGDCKDKVFLLRALLEMMDISSTPVLVHTTYGKTLSEHLPFPTAFNHVVLQLNINGSTYFVDPVRNLQGGSLKTTFFPNYTFGLPLAQDTKDLTKFPENTQNRASDIDISFRPYSENKALLELVKTFYDSKAENIRRILEKDGLSKFSEKDLSELKSVYGDVSIKSEPMVTDNRKDNVITFVSSYLVPIESVNELPTVKVYSNILKYYLDNNYNPERSSPYEIVYPLWIKEHIHLEELYPDITPLSGNFSYENEAFLFSYFLQKDNNSADAYLELRHLQDHVSKDNLDPYYRIVEEIKGNFAKKTPSNRGKNTKCQHPENKRFTEAESLEIAICFLDKLFSQKGKKPISLLEFFDVDKGPELWSQAYSLAFGQKTAKDESLSQEEVLTVLIELCSYLQYNFNDNLQEITNSLFLLKYVNPDEGISEEYQVWKESLAIHSLS